jgi:hypothetical protein
VFNFRSSKSGGSNCQQLSDGWVRNAEQTSHRTIAATLGLEGLRLIGKTDGDARPPKTNATCSHSAQAFPRALRNHRALEFRDGCQD